MNRTGKSTRKTLKTVPRTRGDEPLVKVTTVNLGNCSRTLGDEPYQARPAHGERLAGMNLQQYVRDVGTVCVIRPMLVKLPRESALEVLFRFFELPAFFSARNSASKVFARFFEVVSFFPGEISHGGSSRSAFRSCPFFSRREILLLMFSHRFSVPSAFFPVRFPAQEVLAPVSGGVGFFPDEKRHFEKFRSAFRSHRRFLSRELAPWAFSPALWHVARAFTANSPGVGVFSQLAADISQKLRTNGS